MYQGRPLRGHSAVAAVPARQQARLLTRVIDRSAARVLARVPGVVRRAAPVDPRGRVPARLSAVDPPRHHRRAARTRDPAVGSAPAALAAFNVSVTRRAAPRAEFVDPLRSRAAATTGAAVLPTCAGTEDVSVGSVARSSPRSTRRGTGRFADLTSRQSLSLPHGPSHLRLPALVLSSSPIQETCVYRVAWADGVRDQAGPGRHRLQETMSTPPRVRGEARRRIGP
jgi:hypothetical protein